MVIRNRLLYDKVMKLTKKVAAFLEKTHKEQYPTRTDYIYSFKERGFEAKEEIKTDYGWLLLGLRETISQFPELEDCVTYMVRNPLIRRTFKLQDKDWKSSREA